MSLSRQLLSGILAVLFLVFATSVWIGVTSTRDYVEHQLESHAQDTATSLGLSISPYLADPAQLPQIDAMLNAIFDHGYYHYIVLTSSDGQVLLEKRNPHIPDDVPGWFISTFPLRPPEVTSEVNSGWHIAATLVIQSHPGLGYQQLWQNAKQSFWQSFGIFLFATILALLLTRQITRPLNAAVEQVKAIGRGNFTSLSVHTSTLELQVFVNAINQMSAVLSKLFAELTQQAQTYRDAAFKDKLTGIGNRRAFDLDFEQRLNSRNRPQGGYLLLLRLSSLARLNREFGGDVADNYITDTCKAISEHLSAQSLSAALYRMRGADFAVLLDQFEPEHLETYCDELMSGLTQHSGQGLEDGIAHMGIARYEAGEQAQKVIEMADSALTQALHREHGWQLAENMNINQSAAMWRAQIQQILTHQEVKIFRQPVKAKQGTLLYQECLARFALDDDDGFLPMDELIPVTERFRHSSDIDRLVVSHVFSQLKTSTDTLAVNIAGASVNDDRFCAWLEHHCHGNKSLCPLLVFEISEACMIQSPKNLIYMSKSLHECGAKVTIEHFGSSVSSFAYLTQLRPDFIKLDGRFTRDIHKQTDSQFYVQSLVNIAHGLGIQVIAEQVETAAQANQLHALFVDYLQGYFIDRPALWK